MAEEALDGSLVGGHARAAEVLGDGAQGHECLGRVGRHGRPVVGDGQQDGQAVGVGRLAGVEAVADSFDETPRPRGR